MKDIPLSEITLRKYEKPENLEKRELIRKICLSLGLLQLADSRDIIVDVLMVLIDSNKTKESATSASLVLLSIKPIAATALATGYPRWSSKMPPASSTSTPSS